MLILTGQQSEGDPYETLTEECTAIVSAGVESWHESFLASPPFSGFGVRAGTRWVPRMLAFVAVLMAWGEQHTLGDRLQAACESVTAMFPSRRRVGKTYQGFVKGLLGLGDRVLEVVMTHLRGVLQEIAGPYWTRDGFVAFAVDGSRVECPRTEANEQDLGCGGRKGTGPQLWLTCLWHMGTGLPWAWMTGASTDSERTHLRELLCLLPALALLVADAGFTGYELLRDIVSSGRSFLIRVGSNVRLLKELGYAEVEDGQTVYLWPSRFQKANHPPLVFRLIVLKRKGENMYLLTNLPAERLSDRQARILYEMRWGVELFYRSMKDTLGRRKMLSWSPKQARAELGWTLVGLQLLGLLSVEQIIVSGKDPLSWSVAASLRVVRLAIRDSKPRGSRQGGLMGSFRRALKDRYHRTNSKRARHWPHKKRESPPGAPEIRKPTEEETQKAKQLRDAKAAA